MLHVVVLCHLLSCYSFRCYSFQLLKLLFRVCFVRIICLEVWRMWRVIATITLSVCLTLTLTCLCEWFGWFGRACVLWTFQNRCHLVLSCVEDRDAFASAYRASPKSIVAFPRFRLEGGGYFQVISCLRRPMLANLSAWHCWHAMFRTDCQTGVLVASAESSPGGLPVQFQDLHKAKHLFKVNQVNPNVLWCAIDREGQDLVYQCSSIQILDYILYIQYIYIYIYVCMYMMYRKTYIHSDILFVYEICNDALLSQVRKYKFYFRFYIQLDHFSRRALSQPLCLQNSLGVAYLQFRLSHTLLVSDSIIHGDTLRTFDNVRLVVKHLQAMRPFPRLQVRSLKEVCIQRVKHSKRTQWCSAPEWAYVPTGFLADRREVVRAWFKLPLRFALHSKPGCILDFVFEVWSQNDIFFKTSSHTSSNFQMHWDTINEHTKSAQ